MLDQLFLEVTTACNSNCVWCNVPKAKVGEGELTTEEWKGVFADIANTVGSVPIVGFTGGEPTLRKDLSELMSSAEEMLMPDHIVLNTNASNPEGVIELFHRISGDKIFFIPVEGDEQIHDEIRGAGSYRKSMRVIEQLRNERGIVMFTTLHPTNIRKIPHALHASKAHQVPWLTHPVLHIKDSSCTYRAEDLLWLSEYLESFDFVQREWTDNKSLRLYLRTMLEFMFSGQRPKCVAGKNAFITAKNGDVYPCPHFAYSEHRLGNWLSDGAEKIVERGKKLRLENCNLCWCVMWVPYARKYLRLGTR